MLMAPRARPMRLISSASSSAPRAVTTRVSPIFFARSWAAEPSNTLGKSSGTAIRGSATSDAVREGGLRGADARARLGLVPEIAQGQLERRQRRQDVLRAGGDPHGADPQRGGPELVDPGPHEAPG